jgi:tRNA-2-methylthio-N6-dimethylallyladenosine synthase
MQGQIEEAVKAERLARLQRLLADQQSAFNLAQVGCVLPVLVAGSGRRPGQMHGRSPYMQSVHFDDIGARAGDIVSVRVVGASQNSLSGRLAEAEVSP